MLTFDLRDFERASRNFNAILDQVPFALAQAMNEGVEFARQELIERTWPQSVTVRNSRFLEAALTTRGNRATKTNLRVAIDDRLGRASLQLHAEGGDKRPKGNSIAIPSSAIIGRVGGSGVPKALRPRALPNSFVTDGRRSNPHLQQGAVYQRTGAYRAAGTKITRTGKRRQKVADFRQVKLMYTLKPSTRIRADVPFDSAFERAMWLGVTRAFGPALNRAMASRR